MPHISDRQTKVELLNYLYRFLSDNRQARFDSIAMDRTRFLTVVLEDIYQPHNASAVMRTCDCFGIQDVHVIENRNKYEINPDVALGSTQWVDIYKYNLQPHNTRSCMAALKQQGYQIIATTPHQNGCMLPDFMPDQKTALVFGTEAEGLSAQAMDEADGYLKIPMYGFTESFNISVSAAIIISALYEKIRNDKREWQLTAEEQLDVKLKWATQSIKRSDLIISEFLKSTSCE